MPLLRCRLEQLYLLTHGSVVSVVSACSGLLALSYLMGSLLMLQQRLSQLPRKTMRTGLQQSGSGPLKGGVEITTENLKGEVPNDKYRNALCIKLHCAQAGVYKYSSG